MTDIPEDIMAEAHAADDIEIGQVQWHCSEEGSGPDVGLLLRLDASCFLWAGEITRDAWEDARPDAAELGDDCGWWAMLYEEGGGRKTVLGRFIDTHTAQYFIELIASIISAAERRDDARASYANLINIIADIREKSGVGGKPMLGELADAIEARMAAAEHRGAERERERCAKVAEERVPLWEEAEAIAAAIRRGEG